MDERSFQSEPDGTWSAGASLGGSDERTRIILRCASGVAEQQHLAAALDVLNRWPEFKRALEPALFAFYCRIDALATESGPEIASPAEVWAHAELSEIEVIANEHGQAEYVHGFGHCSWEPEHGLEVVTRGNAEPLYVGTYEGWNPDHPPTDRDWNFADPATQERAIAERLTDSGMGDYVSSLPPEDRDPLTGAPKRPWWKLW